MWRSEGPSIITTGAAEERFRVSRWVVGDVSDMAVSRREKNKKGKIMRGRRRIYMCMYVFFCFFIVNYEFVALFLLLLLLLSS